MDVQEHVRAQLVRYLVQRAITCPITGEVLDVRTCVVIVDVDGDPAMVLSPEGGRLVAATAGALRPGYSIMATTSTPEGR